jgi:hypothetical protein
MINLELNQEDTAILRDAIQSYLNDLHDEIAHTENVEFREALQERQKRLTAIVERLYGGS